VHSRVWGSLIRDKHCSVRSAVLTDSVDIGDHDYSKFGFYAVRQSRKSAVVDHFGTSFVVKIRSRACNVFGQFALGKTGKRGQN
jgi:hypothetical protein